MFKHVVHKEQMKGALQGETGTPSWARDGAATKGQAHNQNIKDPFLQVTLAFSSKMRVLKTSQSLIPH